MIKAESTRVRHGIVNERRPLAAAIAASVALVLGCGPGEGDGADRVLMGRYGVVEFEAEPLAPVTEGPNAFRIALREVKTDGPVLGAALAVRAHMPSMGHTSPGDAVVEEQGGGVYTASNVVVSMPGLWEVHYRAEGAGVVDEAAFTYDVR